MKRFGALILSIIMVFTLSTAVLGAEYKPSIEQTEPELLTALINGVNVINEVIITTTGGIMSGDLSVLSPEAIKANTAKLMDAYKEIKEAAKLQDIIPGLDKNKKYIVTQVFDLTPAGTAKDSFEKGNPLTVEMDLDIARGANVKLATKCADKWELLPSKDVTVKANGNVSATFRELCPIAVIQEVSASEGGDKAPITDDNLLGYSLLLLGSAVVVVAGAVVIGRKKA